MSLRARMGLVAGLAVALAVVLVAAVVYGGTRSELRGQVDQALAARAAPIAAAGADGGHGPRGAGDGGRRPHGTDGRGAGGDPSRAAAATPDTPFGGPSGTVQFVSRTGAVYRPPDDRRWSIPVSREARGLAASSRGTRYEDLNARGVHIRVLTTGLGSGGGAVQVARPLTEVDSTLSNQLILLIVIGAAGIAIAGLLGLVVARTALSPITRFTRRTEDLSSHVDLSQRLEVKGRDELARLAQSFNQTLDALSRSVDAQRNLVADASHELRTPIATLRANIQLMADGDRLSASDRESIRRDVINELDELTALVGDVVELARGTKPDTSGLDEVRLDEIARDQVERAQRQVGDPVFAATLEPTVVSGEPQRINRAVSNLLDNARKWSPPGAAVDVDLQDGVLTVRDRGPGFTQEDLPHVFDRFYRAAQARGQSGSGLGLAIVRQAAEAHGGFVEAANAPDGGAVLRVSFGPATRPARDDGTDVPADVTAPTSAG